MNTENENTKANKPRVGNNGSGAKDIKESTQLVGFGTIKHQIKKGPNPFHFKNPSIMDPIVIHLPESVLGIIRAKENERTQN